MSDCPVESLLNALASVGVEIRIDGDRLRFRPATAVSPDRLMALRAHKPAIVSVLANLAKRLRALRHHVDSRSADQDWCERWNCRMQRPDGWRSPLRVAGYLIEDQMIPAAACGNVARFDEFEAYIRDDLLVGLSWETHCVRS